MIKYQVSGVCQELVSSNKA